MKAPSCTFLPHSRRPSSRRSRHRTVAPGLHFREAADRFGQAAFSRMRAPFRPGRVGIGGRDSIHGRRSSLRQAVQPSLSATGRGNSPAATLRCKVAALHGIISKTFRRRLNPPGGKTSIKFRVIDNKPPVKHCAMTLSVMHSQSTARFRCFFGQNLPGMRKIFPINPAEIFRSAPCARSPE